MTPLPPEAARTAPPPRRFISRRGHVVDPVTRARIPVEGLAERTPLYDGATGLPAGSFNGVEFLGAEDQGNRHLTRRANKLLRRALKRGAKPVFDDDAPAGGVGSSGVGLAGRTKPQAGPEAGAK